MPTDAASPPVPPRVLMAHPVGDAYGSDRMLVESARALGAAGWEVTVAVGTDGPLRGLLEPTGARYVVRPVPVLRKAFASPSGLVALARELPPGRRACAELIAAADPDLVYVNTLTMPLWAATARRAGRAVLCHVHEAEYGLPRPARLVLAAPLLAAHRVVANSATTKTWLGSTLPPLAARTVVVRNGVAGPPGPPSPPRARLDGPVRLAVIGRMSPRKGTDLAVEVLARLVASGLDAELTVVGDVFPGYEWFAAQVRELAERGGVTDRVHFTGALPQVWDVLDRTDLVLVPSHGESFGNVVVEAMLAERPVIVSDTHGLTELVRHAENGLLCPPGDAAAWADAVRAAVADWGASAGRAAVARAEAQQRYALATYHRDLVATATELLTTRRSHRRS